MLGYAALIIATLALLVALLAVARVRWLTEAVGDALTKQRRETDAKQGSEIARLNNKIDRSQASLRKSLSDFRGEVRRALADPPEETPPEPETTEEPAIPRRRRGRKTRLNLFERIAADETTIPDGEDKPK